jgi:hypothetical protein
MIMTCLSGLHEGLALLKDLSNPSIPNRTYMSEKSFLNVSGILRVQCLMGLHGV